MFAKKFRLPAVTHFEQSSVMYTPYFTLKVAENKLDFNRYGFIVSKKVDKRATVRNRIKRRMRACVENMKLSSPSGKDMLFILKSEAVSQDTSSLCRSTTAVLGKLI